MARSSLSLMQRLTPPDKHLDLPYFFVIIMPRESEREDRARKELAQRREQRTAFRNAVHQCELCSDLVKSRKKCHWGKATYGYGDIDSPTIFIGEAPGRDGCGYTGIPFTKDRSGKLYNWVLNYLGVKMEETYTTNIVKCFPSDRDGKNRTPTSAEVRACLPHFLNELRVVKPKGIVALGRVPERILRDYKAMNPHLKLIQIPIVYIPHPAYIIRTGGQPGSDKAKQYANRFIKFLGVSGPAEVKSLDSFFQ